ncbi:GNAT family N-acetyltransferase [Nocardioides pinisoli]|uniref:GNAT family N-acetyltransferase n=1 Tax=Nocardioides pinisoli TaxID=2950279 RepID=A0ABT1KX63_9ACTN|nr:GNAT family N-acetyltransferase [Nocardioides pinisoli]MCP3422353.1 GNAT family N-acetyltransferase [Nocardioides pinisoli]
MPSRPVLREMRESDVPAVLAVQEPAAVAGLSEVFPQDRYPFPREAIATRWREEVADPLVACFVVEQEGRVAGFAAIAGDEVLHFGTALDTWGSGLATAAHDELVERLRAEGVVRPRLFVYAGNARGRRFWHKHGWRPTGEVTSGSFPPYAELLAYELHADRR